MHVLTSPVEDVWQRALRRSHAQDAQAAFAQHCCSDVLLTTAVFARLLFVRQPFGVISGSSVSLLRSLSWEQAKGRSLGSVVLDRSITFSRCLGLDNQARPGDVDCQFRLIVLSREVALAVVYQSWRGDAEPGTCCGPQLGQTPVRHSSRYRACKAKFNAFGRELAGGDDYQCFLESCHSQLSPIGGHQFRS